MAASPGGALRRVVYAVAIAGLAVAWLWAASLLWDTTVPSGLELPELDAESVFDPAALREAEDYETLVRWLFIASQVALVAVLAVYTRRGARFAGESAAGPIGTGFLIGMMGLALVWLAQLPFGLVELWWSRRHDVVEIGYLDYVVEDFLALGGEFLFVCLALLVTMVLARLLRSAWWLPATAVFVGLAALFALLGPYLTPGLERPDARLAADARRLARVEGLPAVPVRVQEVREFTNAPNAYAFGLGETRRVVLWDTLAEGDFSRREVRSVLAHELGHHEHDHIAKQIGWFALLVLPAALAVAVATRRRGLADPAAVPVALFVVVILILLTTPLQSATSRRYEAEADWAALEATADPTAMESLHRQFTDEVLADPDPPAWFSFVFDSHPSGLDRVAMARAWRRFGAPRHAARAEPATYERPADPIEIALAWAADEPHVAPAVARVTRTRLEFLRRIFTELGLADDEAADRAWLAYGFYVGHHQLGRNADLGELGPASLDRVVKLLTAPAVKAKGVTR